MNERALMFVYSDPHLHLRELQISVHSAWLPELRAYCDRKHAFRRQGALQGRLVLRVPLRSAEECRMLWKRRGFSIHADHRALRGNSTASLRFFSELSVECAGEGAQAQLLEGEEGGTCRLLLPPTLFEEFFCFLSRFAEGHWAYRFEAGEDIWVSSDLIDPTPEQEALWNEDI